MRELGIGDFGEQQVSRDANPFPKGSRGQKGYMN